MFVNGKLRVMHAQIRCDVKLPLTPSDTAVLSKHLLTPTRLQNSDTITTLDETAKMFLSHSTQTDIADCSVPATYINNHNILTKMDLKWRGNLDVYKRPDHT